MTSTWTKSRVWESTTRSPQSHLATNTCTASLLPKSGVFIRFSSTFVLGTAQRDFSTRWERITTEERWLKFKNTCILEVPELLGCLTNCWVVALNWSFILKSQTHRYTCRYWKCHIFLLILGSKSAQGERNEQSKSSTGKQPFWNHKQESVA